MTNKDITKFLAFIWIFGMCTYTSLLIGTLAHELMHQHYSIETSAIEVNYDRSGHTTGSFFRHSHEWVYLNGFIVEITLIIISGIAIVILGGNKE